MTEEHYDINDYAQESNEYGEKVQEIDDLLEDFDIKQKFVTTATAMMLYLSQLPPEERMGEIDYYQKFMKLIDNTIFEDEEDAALFCIQKAEFLKKQSQNIL